MTISQALKIEESSQHGPKLTLSNLLREHETDKSGAIGNKVIALRFSIDQYIRRPNTVSVSDLADELSNDDLEFQEILKSLRVEAAHELARVDVNLATLRLNAGLSQSDLANLVGTSQSHIAKIENGKNDPGTDFIDKLAIALGQPATNVFGAVRASRSGVRNHD